MDNLTHTLTGYVLGKVPRLKEKDPAFLNAVFWACIIGSNFPDTDFLYASISQHQKLGYLLHHRGHTHTLLGVIPIALIVASIAALIARWPLLKNLRTFKAGLLFCFALVSALLHVLMDFTNSYGVHPFWPLNNEWYYGDTIFIIEPFLWFLFLPFAIISAQTRKIKALWSYISAVTLGIVWFTEYLNPILSSLVTVWFGVNLMLQWSGRSEKSRFAIVSTGLCLIYFSFILCSFKAKDLALNESKIAYPQEEVLDVMASPLPANPFCWNILTLSRAGDVMKIRAGLIEWLNYPIITKTCEGFRSGETTAEFSKMKISAKDESFKWLREFSGSLTQLKELNQTSCEVQAALKFIRFPFWQKTETGWIIGDVRFDRSRKYEFSEVEVSERHSCPKAIPPWEPPARKLLENE